jgi:ferredoxin
MQRFPQPQFETGYVVPTAQNPAVFAWLPPWLEALLLAAVLLLAAWLVLKRRSRPAVVLLALLCLAWYGFVRHGCICPVGATQNVAAATAAGGGLPWLAGFLFAAPLLAALLFGRVFCASVCPLGALQDLTVVRPVRVPRPLDAVLRLGPPLVLALAVLFAACGAGFPVCRADPFVGFFRRFAPVPMLAAGVAVVLLGTVLARPYCRWFCPYGLLLGWCARLAWRHAAITPDECIRCRLCGEACPFDAIREPRAPAPAGQAAAARRRLLLTMLLVPALLAAGALAGRLAAPRLALLHPDVACEAHLAEMAADPQARYLDAEAFRSLGRDPVRLAAQARAVRARFVFGAGLAGGLLGLLAGVRLVLLARQPVRDVYTIERSRCVGCGRCFAVCPRHQVWAQRRRRNAALQGNET